ncbi:hypothetical protein [Leptospira levettii]|uniref:hypothetical protein n=1 Tax=Leptospira levettii TaxID=2023178 RepID=UPI003EBFC2CF
MKTIKYKLIVLMVSLILLTSLFTCKKKEEIEIYLPLSDINLSSSDFSCIETYHTGILTPENDLNEFKKTSAKITISPEEYKFRITKENNLWYVYYDNQRNKIEKLSMSNSNTLRFYQALDNEGKNQQFLIHDSGKFIFMKNSGGIFFSTSIGIGYCTN